jgi:hypothetical protein
LDAFTGYKQQAFNLVPTGQLAPHDSATAHYIDGKEKRNKENPSSYFSYAWDMTFAPLQNLLVLQQAFLEIGSARHTILPMLRLPLEVLPI